MFDKLKSVETRYESLMTSLATPAVQNDSTEYRKQAKAHALDACRTLATIMDRKASRDEADGVKRWLVMIAQRVAEAAKEGGFLGVGGTRVSRAEVAAIRDVASALGVTSPV